MMNTPPFQDRVIVVSGAASGIGRRTAERLAEAGARVIGLDLQVPDAPTAGIDWRRVDVTQEADWEAAIAVTLRAHGRVDGLVNGGGIIVMGAVADLSLADFRRVMAVNVEGTFLGVKHALRAMLPRGEGSIVNISSIAGIAGAPGAGAYCASKGAVRLLSKSAALDAIAAGGRVRVNSIHPGLTATPMADDIVRQLGGAPETREALERSLPAGRLADPDEIVDAILFLLSDQSRYVNGSELVVDNGFTAQ